MQCSVSNSTTFISDPSTPTKAAGSNDWFHQTEKAYVWTRNGRVFSFTKNPSVAPFQPIKTNNQNAQEVKTDFVSDEEVAAELGPEYEPPCFQLTHETNIRNAKEQILERRKKESIQGIIKYISKSMD